MRTFSYVVDHDEGYAPNPQRGICTLVQCKFRGHKRNRNIVEIAKKPDVIIGTGGCSKRSTGNGTLIYAMRVTIQIPFLEYRTSDIYKGRVDRRPNNGNEYALISHKFIYFGKDAINIGSLPTEYHNIEKKGPGFRYLKPDSIGNDLLDFLIIKYGKGMKGCPKSNEFQMHPTLKHCRPLDENAVL
jgi:hypothetical protein